MSIFCFRSLGGFSEKKLLQNKINGKTFYAKKLYISLVKALRPFIWYMNDKIIFKNQEVIPNFIISADFKLEMIFNHRRKSFECTSKCITVPSSVHQDLKFKLKATLNLKLRGKISVVLFLNLFKIWWLILM